MNTLLLSIGMLLSNFVNGTARDTIILNAGKDSRIIFYGKSPQDMKKLELLDLNKILRELNEKQNNTDSSKQYVRLDERGFINESDSEQQLTWLQKYLENTFVNLHIGKGNDVNRYVFFQPAPALLNHSTASLTSEIVLENKLTTSLSVAHDMKLIDHSRYFFAFRYGAGIGFNTERYLHWNLLQSVPAGDVSDVTERAQALLKNENVMPAQSDFNAFQSFLQVTPKFALKNKNGQSSVYLSAGIRLNYNRIFENVDPGAYASGMFVNSSRGGTTTTYGPVIRGGGYNAFSKKSNVGISYLAEAGYKWIGIFVNYNPDYVSLTTNLVSGPDRADSGFTNGKKGKIGYISFGIRLGR
jgi:hypothetical protein